MNISEADNFDFDIEGKKHKQIFDFILSCFIEDNSPTFVAEYNEVLNNILVSIDDEPFFTIHVEYVGKFYDSKSKISLNPYAPKNMHKQSIIVKDFSSEEQLRVIMLINEIKQESIGYDIRRPTLSTENKILSLVLEELRKNKSVSAYEYDDIQEKVLVYIDNKICFSISLSWDGTPPSKRKYFLSTKPYYSIKSHKITNDLSKDYTYLGCEITNQTQDVINHFIDLQVNNVIFLLDKMKKKSH